MIALQMVFPVVKKDCNQPHVNRNLSTMDVFLNYPLPSVLASSLVIVGFLGAFLPLIPATVLMWVGFVLFKYWPGAPAMSWIVLIFATFLMLLAQVVDWVASYWGVRKLGGTWRGGLGAIVGVIFGPLLGSIMPGVGTLVGLLVGPVVGAVIGELAGNKRFWEAHKAALGTLLGAFVAYIIKIMIAVVLLVLFIFAVLFPGASI